MCDITAGAKIAKKDFKVYKVVRNGRFSQYTPGNRGAISRWCYDLTVPYSKSIASPGRVLRYRKGTVVVSPSGPGIMAYRTKRVHVYAGTSLITLLVKKGTRYFSAMNNGYRCVCAAKVKVLD